MITETVNNGPLFARIAAVMAAVRSLPKDGHNTQNNFHYVSSDTALDRIGKAMADNNLVIIPMLTDYETADEKPGNSVRTRTRARFQMHICDSDGNSFLCPWAAEGVDYGNPERALNKAMTNATKYFLLKLFVVGAGGEDPDGEATEAARTPVKAPRATQQPVATQKTQQRPATQATQPTETPARETASPAQLNRLHAAGRDFYGDAWDTERPRLVQAVSKGAVESSNDLSPAEAAKLIDGIEKRLAEQASAKFDGATPEARGATLPLASNAASKRMAARIQNGN